MERRQNQRSSINQSAVLVVDGNPLLNWRICNFSLGGLFLAPVRRGPDSTPEIEAAVSEVNKEQIRVELPQPYTGKKEPIATEVRVRHRCTAGVGVSFVNSDNGMLKFLSEKLGETGETLQNKPGLESAPTDSDLTPSSRKTILARLNNIGERYLQKQYSEFEGHVRDQLLNAADNAHSDDEQKELFFALTMLGKESAVIKRRFFSNYKQAQENLSSDPGNSKNNSLNSESEEKLGLVAKDAFDEWALVVGIARSAESNAFSNLFTLEKCLAYMTKASINGETDPFSPFSILESYRHALNSMEFSVKAKETIYSSFSDHVLSPIDSLYVELNSFLDSQGIVKKTPVYGTKPKQKKTVRPSNDQQPKRRKRKGTVETLASLMGVSRRGPAEDEEEEDQGPVASTDEVLDTLSHLPQSTLRSLAERVESELLRNAAPGETLQLPVAARESIAVTERLVNSIQHNSNLGGEIQQFVGNLQIPLVKEVINDPALLADPNHPGRKLLEALGDLAPYLSGATEEQPSEGALTGIIEYFGEQEFLSGNVALDEVTDKIEELITQQKTAYDSNLAMVLESCKEEESYLQAQETILALLTRKVTKSTVPVLVERVLRLGWVGLLANTIFNRGTKSQEWRVFAGLIDIFLKQFSEEKANEPIPARKIESLITVLKKGFERYPVHIREAGKFISGLEESLEKGSDKFAEYIKQRTTISKNDLKAMMRDQMPSVSDQGPAEEVEKSWLDLVHNIKVDDWIAEQRDSGQVRLINLAWKSPYSSRLVFVDGKGEKALDTEDVALAELFAHKKYSLLEDKELPLVERTVSNLLENTLEKLKKESDRDPLTGLNSRKALQRELTSLIKNAQADEAHHVLILLDIDHFNVINDSCGYDGGDKLLETVANLIKTYLTREAFVARAGDDEFATLIERCTLDEGFQIAEIQRRALENLKFQWEGASVTVSASIGVAPIDVSCSNPRDLMNQAASARSVAKQDGGNSSRVYQASDEDFERRERMQKSLPIIEKALENGQLSVHCQLIKPVFAGDGDKTYHEMLLRIKDENGKPSSAEEFIKVAEQHNRMRSVDRWVVDTIFSWLDKNHDKLNNDDSFSINLSGQSVTDQAFAEHLHEKLDNSPFPNERLAFEITETALATQIDKAQEFLGSIQKKGCKTFLDDFGSGYASYSYLKDLPTDVIKIAGMFVRDMLKDKNSHAMVKSITEIAHFMKKQVIAEYVQDEATIIALTQLEVDYVQGYGVGIPAELNTLVRETV
jgi:diguanylate cyclase (GGDEF)-like protein